MSRPAKRQTNLDFSVSFSVKTDGGEGIYKTDVFEVFDKIREGHFSSGGNAICFGGILASSGAQALLKQSDLFAVAFFCKDKNYDKKRLVALCTRLPWVVGTFTGDNGVFYAVVIGKEPESPSVARDARLFGEWLSKIEGVAIDARPQFTVPAATDPDCFVRCDPVPFEPADAFKFAPLEDMLTIWAKVLEPVWNLGKDYALYNADLKDYQNCTETQAWRPFLTSGFPKIRKDELMDWIRNKKALSAIYNDFVGYNAGIHNINGKRCAVARGPEWIEAFPSTAPNGAPTSREDIEVCCATTLKVLRARFDNPDDPRQFPTLITWLQRARRRIRYFLDEHDAGRDISGELVNCPMLCVMGAQSTGKTRLFKNIIAPMLGNRFCDARRELAVGERFNADLISNEILLIDDISSVTVAEKGRAHFGQNIKSYLYGGGVSAEAKHANKVAIKNPCYVAVQLFNEREILSTPDVDACRDKVLFVCTDKYSALDEDNHEEMWEETNAQIKFEMQYFAAWVDSYRPPADVAVDDVDDKTIEAFERRNGMRFYCAQKCMDMLIASDRSYSLLERYDNNIKTANVNATEKYYNKPMSSTEILAVLSFNNSARLPSAVNLGLAMRDLALSNPGRVKVVARNGGAPNRYIILPPPDDGNPSLPKFPATENIQPPDTEQLYDDF